MALGRVRYRFRRVIQQNPQEWSEAVRLRRIMRRIRNQQQAHRVKETRSRRRSRPWRRWFANANYFRSLYRARLWKAAPGIVEQVQYGKEGPIDAVLKFRIPPPELTTGQKIIESAKSCLGIVYGFGESNGPEDPGKDELDCSGFTEYTHGIEGIFLPHNAEMQRQLCIAQGVFFHDESRCEPGDLVLQWYENSRGIPRGHASHVGHWLSPGREIDTRSMSKPVAVRDIESGSVVGYGRPRRAGQQR